MRTREIKLSNFSECRPTNNGIPNLRIDQKLMPILKKIISIPRQADNSFLFMATDLGGAGLTTFRMEYDIQNVVQAFTMLPCIMTTYIIACTNLFKAASSRFTARPMTIDLALPYLNGAEVAKGGLTHKTWLSRSRKSVLNLKKSGIEVKFIYEEGIFKLYINSPNLPTAIITYVKRK